MSGKLISLENVSVCFPKQRGIFHRKKEMIWPLRGVSLDIHRGETLGVIGRNGAGKSTLLQIIADIIEPDKGRKIGNGYSATLLSIQLGFLPYLPGRENIVLSGMLLGIGRARILAKIDDIIAFSELGEFIDQPVSTYSSGMRARLGFSIAMEMHPDILLIDEALSVGDVGFQDKSRAALLEKIGEKQTAVYVSHSQQRVRELCGRTIWLEKGEVLADGDTEAVLLEYRNFMKTVCGK